jgi:hypothetical protein
MSVPAAKLLTQARRDPVYATTCTPDSSDRDKKIRNEIPEV